jgi:AraC-like DNA-binding protein
MEYLAPLLYIGISQSFFAGIVIATKKPKSIADRLMAALLFMICIEMSFALINSTGLEMYSFPFITFTYGPLQYLYVLFITQPQRKYNWFSLLHFIPFTAFFTVSVIFRSQPLVRDLRSFLVPDEMFSLRIVYSISFFLSITVYSTLTFLNIWRHQKNLKNLISYSTGVTTLNWLKFLSIGFYLSYFILFLLGGLNIIGNYIPFDPYFIIFGFITIFSFAYSFYSIRQPVIFGKEAIEYSDEKKEPERYSKSGLKDEQADSILKSLIDIVEKEKLYLDRDLTIHGLSRRTGIPRHHITQVLNEKHGRNFFSFINEYRVKEVLKRFSDIRYNNYTILAIALDSGFNSKTTFNSIFKSITGKTPSQCREEMTGISS